jgi:hypothetical protein
MIKNLDKKFLKLFKKKKKNIFNSMAIKILFKKINLKLIILIPLFIPKCKVLSIKKSRPNYTRFKKKKNFLIMKKEMI